MSKVRRAWLAAAASAAAVAALLGLAALKRHAIAADLRTERDLHRAAYAGAAACRDCHPDNHRSWRRTFHRTMTQDASPGAGADLRGDFSGAVYRYGGVTARMDRDPAGTPRISFARDGDPGPPVVALVSRAIGSRRYQQYLTRVGDQEYRLPVAFSIEENRWFHMNGAFLFAGDPERVPGPPRDELGRAKPALPHAIIRAAGSAIGQIPRFGGNEYDRHVTRWNDNCVFCHNVGPNPGADGRGAFQTTVAELGIACEACHGPGGEHIRANRDPMRRLALRFAPGLAGAADPTIVNPARLSPSRAADVCGRCHGQRLTDDIGRFLEHGDPFVPGDDLALYSEPLWQGTTLRGQAGAFAARFWDDGTARLTAYEYQGLLQSPCAQRGALTCISCHGMHDGDPRGQLRPAAAGDGACTGCHAALRSDDAKGRHAHHDPGGPGARCTGCHMPRIVFGVLDVHRSHRIEVPDPARAAAAGRPDACTGCHVERTRTWATAELTRMWGAREGAPAVAAGPAAAGPLEAVLSGDPIARAVAADAIGRAPPGPGGAPAAAARRGLLLDVMAADDYPAVRHLAWRALRRLTTGGAAPLPAYEATADAGQRGQACAAIRRALPAGGVTDPDPATVRRLRGQARLVAIEIGE